MKGRPALLKSDKHLALSLFYLSLVEYARTARKEILLSAIRLMEPLIKFLCLLHTWMQLKIQKGKGMGI